MGAHLFDPTEVLSNLETVIYEKKPPIAYITLNRPEHLNGLSERSHLELYGIWLDIKRDPNIVVTIMTGNGRAFCAGRDVKELVAAQANPSGQAVGAVGREDPLSLRYDVRGFPYVAEMDKPIIAAVNGLAAAGGTALLATAHIRIMAEDAWISDIHLHTGQLGNPAKLVRNFPGVEGNAMVLCNKRINAQACLRLGWVNEVVPKAQLMETAEAYAEMMLENPPSLLFKATELINLSRRQDPVLTALEMSANTYARDEDPAGGEGPAAFVAKRPAAYAASASR